MYLGQNSTFFRGTLETMPSKGLQNCPRAAEHSSRPEGSFAGPRTASLEESRGKRWNFGPEDNTARNRPYTGILERTGLRQLEEF